MLIVLSIDPGRRTSNACHEPKIRKSRLIVTDPRKKLSLESRQNLH